LDKIQIIEKLFKYTLEYALEYSYLLLPIFFIVSRFKSKKSIVYSILALYGLTFFLFLHFFYWFPSSYRRFEIALYTLLEYSFFAFLISYFIQNKKLKKIIFFISILFFLFQVYFFLKGSKYSKLDSVPIAIETFLIFSFIIFYFRQFFRNNISKNVYEYPSFWLIVGILIYLGSAFFFNLLVNDVTEEQFKKYWHYTYIPDILKNCIFSMIILGYPSISNEKSSTEVTIKDIPNLDMI
jgi:hypothetical protein